MRGKDKKICGEMTAESIPFIHRLLTPFIRFTHNNKLYRINFGYRPTAAMAPSISPNPATIVRLDIFFPCRPLQPPISPLFGALLNQKKVLERWPAFLSLYYSTKIIGNMGNELKMCRSNRCCNSTPARRV